MAFIPSYYAAITFGGSEQKLGTVRMRVSVADGQAWINAADQTARDATKVGLLFAAAAALSAGTVYDYSVTLNAENDTFAFPDQDDNAYLFDKLTVHYRAGLDRYVMTIPARDDDAYLVAADGTTVELADAAAVANFVAQMLDTCLAKNGTAATVEKITVTQ